MGPQTTVEDLSDQVLLVFVAMAIGSRRLLPIRKGKLR